MITDVVGDLIEPPAKTYTAKSDASKHPLFNDVLFSKAI